MLVGFRCSVMFTYVSTKTDLSQTSAIIKVYTYIEVHDYIIMYFISFMSKSYERRKKRYNRHSSCSVNEFNFRVDIA